MLDAYPIIHQALRTRSDRGRGAGRISPHQAVILAQLDRAEPTTVSELAARMNVALPTMSLMLNRLVRNGLVRRDRDRADRRRVLVRLSSDGIRTRARFSLIDPVRVRSLLAAMTPAERSAGVNGLVTLARAARKLATKHLEPTVRSKETE